MQNFLYSDLIARYNSQQNSYNFTIIATIIVAFVLFWSVSNLDANFAFRPSIILSVVMIFWFSWVYLLVVQVLRNLKIICDNMPDDFLGQAHIVNENTSWKNFNDKVSKLFKTMVIIMVPIVALFLIKSQRDYFLLVIILGTTLNYLLRFHMANNLLAVIAKDVYQIPSARYIPFPKHRIVIYWVTASALFIVTIINYIQMTLFYYLLLSAAFSSLLVLTLAGRLLLRQFKNNVAIIDEARSSSH